MQVLCHKLQSFERLAQRIEDAVAHVEVQNVRPVFVSKIN